MKNFEEPVIDIRCIVTNKIMLDVSDFGLEVFEDEDGVAIPD